MARHFAPNEIVLNNNYTIVIVKSTKYGEKHLEHLMKLRNI